MLISIKISSIYLVKRLKAKDVAFINQTLEDLHAADVADLIENLDTGTRNKLIEIEAFAY